MKNIKPTSINLDVNQFRKFKQILWHRKKTLSKWMRERIALEIQNWEASGGVPLVDDLPNPDDQFEAAREEKMREQEAINKGE